MSILVNKNSRILVCGISGKSGSFHSKMAINYGTNIVAGVCPGKGGSFFEAKIPIFDSVFEAKKYTQANVAIIFVPPASAADSIFECIFAEMDLIVCITEGIPVHDMIKIKACLKNSKSRLIGPNCPGILTPCECTVGIIPTAIAKKGSVGIISRSGTLLYESILQLSLANYGLSTCVGIGGDPIIGESFTDMLELFENDVETSAVVMIGEIGGQEEIKVAEMFAEKKLTKPLVAYIAGTNIPKRTRMGHAGAIFDSYKESAKFKIEQLKSCGLPVTSCITEIATALQSVMDH